MRPVTEGRRLPVQTNLTNFVRFMEPRADPQSIYVAADVFVMNAACENFARVVLEAMAMHLPVLGTRCGGTAEQVKGASFLSLRCVLCTKPPSIMLVLAIQHHKCF